MANKYSCTLYSIIQLHCRSDYNKESLCDKSRTGGKCYKVE